MHHFFIPAEWIDKAKVTIIGPVAHQIRNVLRMKVGHKIVVLDNYGSAYHVSLTHISPNVVIGEVLAQKEADGEPALQISLYQGTLKAQKFEWVLQKGTELGLTEFIPIICERSVLGDVEAVDKKMMRWERIIQEAAEQSKRGRLPELRPAMMFAQASHRASRMAAPALIAWEKMEAASPLKTTLTTLDPKPQHLSLFIGSEGGFTIDEIRMAHGYNITPISLGKRILRAETAPIVAASAILYHFDDLA